MSTPKRLPFQIRWLKAVQKSDLDPTTKFVASAIATHMNRYGLAWPAKTTLAQNCSRSLSAVKRALDRLEAAGWITVEQSYGKNANRYQGHLNPVPVAKVQGVLNRVTRDPVKGVFNRVTHDRVEEEDGKVPNRVILNPPTGSPVTHEVKKEDKTLKSKPKNTVTVGRPYRAGTQLARRPRFGDEDFPTWLAAALSPGEQPFVSYPGCGSYPAHLVPAILTVAEAEQAFAAHRLVVLAAASNAGRA